MIERFVFPLYLVSLPFVSAFALTQILSLPLVLALTITVGILPAWKRNTVNWPEGFLFLLLASSTVSEFFLLARTGDVLSIYHFASLWAAIALYYLGPKEVISRLDKGQRRRAGSLIAAAVGVSIGYLVMDFVAMNVYGHQVSLPRPAVTDYEPTALGSIYRARSFTEESGHFAFYVLASLPVALALRSREFSAAISVTLAVALIVTLGLTLSVAGLVATAVGVVSGAMLVPRKSTVLIAALTVGLCVLAVQSVPDELNVVIQRLGSTSALDRQFRALQSFDLWERSDVGGLLFGLGPGYYRAYAVDSVIGLYALFLPQYGMVGFAAFLGFLVSSTIALCKNYGGAQRYLLAFAIAATAVMYVSVSNYWLPWAWLCFAVGNGEAGAGRTKDLRQTLERGADQVMHET